jgi:CheY-like chemotaxis protein
MNVRVAQGLLQRWGGVVEVATNGQEALDQLDAARHRLVLMDLHMPVLDGYEATRRLRARGETLPIIALTASLGNETSDRLRETGLDDVVVKPFKPDELLRVLLQYLGRVPAATDR